MIYNIQLFVPLGVILKKANFDSNRCIMYTAVASLTIESIQLILGLGLVEISDLVNNTIRGAIGVNINNYVLKGMQQKYMREKSD